MKANRRTVGLTLLAVAATPARALQMACDGGGWEDEPTGWWRGTPVEPLTRQILSSRIRRLQPATLNATREQHEAHIRAIFPQVIEQNFARMRSPNFGQYMRQTSDRELSELAQLYNADVNALSRPGRLLPLLAVQAGDAELQRWARAFGAMPMFDAIARFAPQKLPRFERALPSGSLQQPPLNQGFQPNLDMTILRIYQGFRSAPIGASSISASIYQTATYSGGHLSTAFGAGYLVGSGISYLLVNYAPSLHELIGGVLYEFMQGLSGLTGIPISQAQEEISYNFQLADLSSTFEHTGGDYGAVEQWSVAAGYGGAGC